MRAPNYLPNPAPSGAVFGADAGASSAQTPPVVVDMSGMKSPLMFFLTLSVGVAVGYVLGKKT